MSGSACRESCESQRLAVSFHQVVHPVLSGEAGVAKLQPLLGGPDERSSECPADAAQSSRTGAAGGGRRTDAGGVAAACGITVKTVRKWVARFQTEGVKGLHDRSSRPHHLHRPTPAATVATVEALR